MELPITEPGSNDFATRLLDFRPRRSVSICHPISPLCYTDLKKKGFPKMTSIIPSKLHRANNVVFTDRVLRERYGYDSGQTESDGGIGQPLYRDSDTPDCDCFDKNIFEAEEESENINEDMASLKRQNTESSPEVADLMRQPFRVFGITFAPLSIPFQRRLQVWVYSDFFIRDTMVMLGSGRPKELFFSFCRKPKEVI